MIVSLRSPSCAAVVIGLALRYAPSQANKQNRGCYRSSVMGIVAPRASWRGIFSRKTEIGTRKEKGSISKEFDQDSRSRLNLVAG
jgi:hypothetical protein